MPSGSWMMVSERLSERERYGEACDRSFIPTSVWFETDYSVYTMRQASLRQAPEPGQLGE